jgi:hypothetical protein
MAVVSFSGEDIWLVARWAFKKLFSDMQDKFLISPDIQYSFEEAMALDGLHFDLLENNKDEILDIMKATILELTDDDAGLYRKNLDEKGYQMYKGALPELLEYIEKYEGKNDESRILS